MILAAASTQAFPVLGMLVVLPLLGAAAVLLLPRSRVELVRPVAVLFMSGAAAVAGWIIVEYPVASGGFEMIVDQTWVAAWGISWKLGVDGISLFLLALTALLFPLGALAVDPGHDHKAYYVWLLLLEFGCLGVFSALDLLLFFLFFEVVLVPMYFLIGQWGHGNARYSAVKFFLFTMFGSALMLVGILATAFLHASATGGPLTFDVIEIAGAQSLATTTARWIFLAFALGFAVKVPLIPVHTWLPDAHTDAPTAGSVILAGVMLKLGTYGFVRFGLYLFPEASRFFAPLMLTLGVVGIIYGAVVATMQTDFKRLIAYSSVAHLGFIILGIFALNTEGLSGGLLQMVNHGISTGALFLLVGYIYERRHTRAIADLGGLARPAPVLALTFLVVMLSSVGLPGLNGFVGEFLVLLGAFEAHRWWAVLATAGVILAAIYLLWAYQRVFHGPARGENAKMVDLNWREGLVLAPLLALIIFLGVYPRPVLDRMEPSVDALVTHVEAHRSPGAVDTAEPEAAP